MHWKKTLNMYNPNEYDIDTKAGKARHQVSNVHSIIWQTL